MITYLLAVVTGLNALYGISVRTLEIGNLTAAQAAAHEVIIAAALAFAERLDHAEYERGDDGWNHFEQGADAPRLESIAAAVAVPDCAATCDPVELVHPDLARRIASVDEIFPNPPAGLNTFSGFHGEQRREYVALAAGQLRAGLLRLHSSCRGGASVFPVGKAEEKLPHGPPLLCTWPTPLLLDCSIWLPVQSLESRSVTAEPGSTSLRSRRPSGPSLGDLR